MSSDIIWKSENNEIISCTEKIKVMQQNITEIQQIAQDAFEDAILMGIDPIQVKEYFAKIMQNLYNPYAKS